MSHERASAAYTAARCSTFGAVHAAVLSTSARAPPVAPPCLLPPQRQPCRHFATTRNPADERNADAPSTSGTSKVDSSTGTSWSLDPLRGTVRIFADASSSDALTDEHIGKYYHIDETLIPEAFEPWYDNRGAPLGKSVPVDGGGRVQPLSFFKAGCPGLQYEFAQSYYPYIMYRCEVVICNCLRQIRTDRD